MKTKLIGILSGVLSLGAIGAASAADMAVKARPAPVVAAIYDWSGIYVGGSLGWEQDRFHWAFAPPIPGAIHQAYDLTTNNGNYGVHGGIQ